MGEDKRRVRAPAISIFSPSGEPGRATGSSGSTGAKQLDWTKLQQMDKSAGGAVSS